MIGFDNEGDVFLIEEEQGLFSSRQNNRTYEDSKEYKLRFEKCYHGGS